MLRRPRCSCGFANQGLCCVGDSHSAENSQNIRACRENWEKTRERLAGLQVNWQFVDARMCTAMGIKVERDQHPEELQMADGTTIKTEGRVQIQLRCGGYRGTVQAKAFPGLQKRMILGMPWLQKENPHINWTQGEILVRQSTERVQLPL